MEKIFVNLLILQIAHFYFFFSNFENNNKTGNESGGNYYEYYNRCNSICYNSKFVKIQYFYEQNTEVSVTTNSINESEYNNESDYSKSDYYSETDFYSDNSFNSDTINIDSHTEIKTIKIQFDINRYFFDPYYYELNNQIMNIIAKGYLCLYNSGKGDELSPTNLRKCRFAEYIESNDTYKCLSCIEGYSLDNETNTCKQSIQKHIIILSGIEYKFYKRVIF